MMQKRQRGLTMISWVFIIGLVGVQVIAAMRIVPVYMDYYSVKKIMEEVKMESAARGAAPNQLTIMLNKRLNINGIYDIQKDQQAFTFQKSREGTKIILHYEVRRPVYGNLEFVATFDHEVDIPAQ